jgi:phosphoribosylformylglycinamidine synthase
MDVTVMTNASFAHVPEPVSVTPELLAQHSITADEYIHIQAALGRVLLLTGLGIYSVMWSQHCSCKSSRVHLKRLPTKSDRVVQRPDENAGIIGVGGIPRDIFTLGARPLVVMDSPRFGPQPRNYLIPEKPSSLSHQDRVSGAGKV